MTPIEMLMDLFALRYDHHNRRIWQESSLVLEQTLRSLSLEQAHELVQMMRAQYDFDEDEYLYAHINMYVPGALVPSAEMLIEQSIFRPGWLYFGATEATAKHLLQLVNATDHAQNRNNLLLSLAWVGGEHVQAQFQEWRATPPPWRSELFIAPEEYAVEAGWECTLNGERRDLYHHTSIELVPPAQQEQAVIGITVLDAICHWCQRPLITLFQIDLSNPRCRFLDPTGTGKLLRIATCSWCYETIFTEVTLTGGVWWSPMNGKKAAISHQASDIEELVLDLTQTLVLGADRKTPFESLGKLRLSEKGISQLGGHPEWVNDAIYPVCPRCQQRMMFIGQVAGDDWFVLGEGIFYAFFCSSCNIATTDYQQT